MTQAGHTPEFRLFAVIETWDDAIKRISELETMHTKLLEALEELHYRAQQEDGYTTVDLTIQKVLTAIAKAKGNTGTPGKE